MPRVKGAVAAGHPMTAAAAEEILREGGNAFDAIVAAHFCACVAEPVLASLAGGGYMLARPAGSEARLYDFFAQTPRSKKNITPDFFPISANFGTVSQEFHIGLGSVAVPGSVRGMFEIHRDLCSLPVSRLIEPAIKAAQDGVRFSHLQAKIFTIVSPIYSSTPEARETYASSRDAGQLVKENDLLKQPNLAATLEGLAREGEKLFYEGEIAHKIQQLCLDGGYLTAADLKNYQVIRRKPLQLQYRDAMLFTNPPPSSGGILIALALKLLEQKQLSDMEVGGHYHLDLLVKVMAETNQARLDMLCSDGDGLAEHLLDAKYLTHYKQQVARRARCLRGTTHLSVMDSQGNAAAMTVSNGEGCGYMVPNTGVMLNNMLGEEDINPAGFHSWSENERMTSMMSPTLLELKKEGTDKASVALGSGGSNRIRTAILQVISNLVDFGMSPEQAVFASRLHYENEILNIEPGFKVGQLDLLGGDYPKQQRWHEKNLFFGGVHTVEYDGRDFHGVGDPRRDGVGIIV